ncbi:MAG: amidohydrolase [Bacteroidales bacterium]
MKITVVQPDIIWEDKPASLRKLDMLISSITCEPDIVILPEMFNTGFSMNPELLYENPGSVTFEWMKSKSSKGNYGICGSYIVGENGLFFNRWLFVSPEGETWSYDKRHLFSPGGEDMLFTRGTKRLVFTYRGVRICPNICYDLRFPVWSRNNNDYDLLINSANWPAPRHSLWLILLKARAIENQCYVVGANRIGLDGAGVNYKGDSVLIDPRGNIISTPADTRECAVSGEISMNELSDFREKFPVLKDADQFSIKL